MTQVKQAGKPRRILRRMTPKRRTLATAAQTLGGPDAIYLAALEIVAKGPFNGTRRKT